MNDNRVRKYNEIYVKESHEICKLKIIALHKKGLNYVPLYHKKSFDAGLLIFPSSRSSQPVIQIRGSTPELALPCHLSRIPLQLKLKLILDALGRVDLEERPRCA